MSKPDYIPRRYHDQQVTALTDRCVAAETAIIDLLNVIAPEVFKSNHYDWLLAVRELLK